MTSRRLAHRLLAGLRWRRLDADLESEILAHLELAEREAVARGLSPEEARRAALLEFGGVEQIKENHRDARGVTWLEHALRDFRHGLSDLFRHPGFALTAVGILALGIGATTAVFSVVGQASSARLSPATCRWRACSPAAWSLRPGSSRAGSSSGSSGWTRATSRPSTSASSPGAA